MYAQENAQRDWVKQPQISLTSSLIFFLVVMRKYESAETLSSGTQAQFQFSVSPPTASIGISAPAM